MRKYLIDVSDHRSHGSLLELYEVLCGCIHIHTVICILWCCSWYWKLVNCKSVSPTTSPFTDAYPCHSDPMRSWVSLLLCYLRNTMITVYPKKYAHGFVVLCFVVVMRSFIMNSHEVFIHIHQGCFAGTGAIVRLPQCQWSKPDGYGKISQCITTTKHSKAKTVCIFLRIYCMHKWATNNAEITQFFRRRILLQLHFAYFRSVILCMTK